MSQHDSESTTINGRRFEVFKLPPLDAQDLLLDILQACAGAVPELAAAAADADDGAAIVSANDVGAIGKIVQALDKQTARNVINVLQGVTHCDGKPLNKVFAEVFRGDLASMYTWVAFALKAQYANLLQPVLNAFGPAVQTVGQAGQSQNT